MVHDRAFQFMHLSSKVSSIRVRFRGEHKWPPTHGHRCGSRKIFGAAKDTCPKSFPVFGQLFVQIFPPTQIMNTFFRERYSPHVGCQFFKIKQHWVPILPLFLPAS